MVVDLASTGMNGLIKLLSTALIKLLSTALSIQTTTADLTPRLCKRLSSDLSETSKYNQTRTLGTPNSRNLTWEPLD